MPDPLPALVDDRSTLLQQFSELGDFQPGSITSATRRCGKPGCHCAKPNDPGHGPHFQLTQKVGGKTVTQNLPSTAAVRKAESEISEFRKFQTLTGELVDVNRKICRLRPVERTEQTAQEKKRRRQSNKKLPAKYIGSCGVFFTSVTATVDSIWKRSRPLCDQPCTKPEPPRWRNCCDTIRRIRTTGRFPVRAV